MKPVRKVLAAALVILIALAACLAAPAMHGWQAASLLQTLATPPPDPPGGPSALSNVVQRDFVLEHASGVSRARLYHQRNQRGPGIVVAHGVHHKGIEEPRLVRFASALADAGFVVLTPQLEDLCQYRITPRALVEIRSAVRWLASRDDLVQEPRVGLMGFSFAGGLGLVAASDPEAQGQLRYAVSIGGHHDLSRVLRFFATDKIDTPDGELPLEAHPYGMVVLLHDHVQQFVGDEDAAPLRGALAAWLREERDLARKTASACRTERCRTVFACAESDDATEVGGQVLSMIERERETLDALSPAGKLRNIAVPVLLLHGTQDNVIPPTELAWADRELKGRDHRALVTPLLDHVSVSQSASWSDYAELVAFMAELF